MKHIVTSILLVFGISILNGQTELVFTPDINAICDPMLIDGLIINLPVSNDDGFFDSDKCDGTRENVIYFSFIAWTDNMDISFLPSSCSSTSMDTKRGIQVSVFNLDDVGDVNVIEDLCECDSSIDDITLSLMNLVLGQQYYVFIDGCAGDVCDVEIELDPAVSNLPGFNLPIDLDLLISDETGEGVFCEGEEISLELVNATDGNYTFIYSIKEVFIDGSSFEYVLETNDILLDTIDFGVDSIIYSLDVFNPCDTIRGIRDTLTVSRFEKEEFPAETICPGDTLNLLGWIGSPLALPVFYSDTVLMSNGCTVIQEIDIDHYSIQATALDTLVCSFPAVYNGVNYTAPVTNQRITIENGDSNGCDSIISVSINEIFFDGQITAVDCIADSSTIHFLVAPSSQFDSIQYEWTIDGQILMQDTIIIGSGQTANLVADVYINGQACQKQFGPFSTNPFSFNGQFDLLSCQDGFVTVQFLPDNSGFDQIDYEWTVNNITLSNNSTAADGIITDEFQLTAFVTDGDLTCSFVFDTIQYWSGESFQALIQPLSCLDDSVTLAIDLIQGQADSIFYSWSENTQTVSIDSQVIASISSLVDLNLNVFNQGEGCSYTYQYSFNNEIPCNASCIPASLVLSALDTLCWDGISPVNVSLSAMASSNMDTTGQGQWLNPEVDNSLSLFTPFELIDSNYVLYYEYVENGDCRAIDSLDLVVRIIPNPLISLEDSEICVGDTINIMADFGPGGVDNANWVLDGATLINGDLNAGGLIQLNYNTQGNYAIFVELINESCNAAIQDTLWVDVVPDLSPLSIDCKPSIDQIEFSWISDDCVDSYSILIDGVFVGDQMDTSFILDDLDPMQMVEFELVANQNCTCKNQVRSVTSCTTNECELRDISFNTSSLQLCDNEFQEIQFTADVQPTILNADPVWTGQGIDENGLFNSQELGPDSFHLYYFVEDGNCAYSDSIEVIIHPAPRLDFQLEVDSCGESTEVIIDYQIIQSTGTSSILLSQEEMQASPTIIELDNGIYDLSIQDETSCSSSESFLIEHIVLADLELLGDEVIIADEDYSFEINTTLFTMEELSSQVWYVDNQIVCEGMSCSPFEVNQAEDFEICVEIIQNDQCLTLACREIIVQKELKYYLPNSFSPDITPGINDEWVIHTNLEDFQIELLEIYDRWGNMVHSLESGSTNDGSLILWDGRYGDSSLNSGVFVYVLRFNFNDQAYLIDGQINLIR